MALGPETIVVQRTVPPPPAPRRKPNYGRRIIWLGVVVIVLIAAYTAAWFWAAGRLEAMAGEALARLDRNPVGAECRDLHAEGYPFRIGLFCSGVALRDAARGASLEAGAFRSAAQVYNPFLVVGEVDGPAKLGLPDRPPLDLSWDVLKASIRLDRPLPDRVSVEARDLKAASAAGQLFAAADMQGHMSPDEGDLRVAGSMRGLTLAPELLKGRTLPPLDGGINATLADGVAWALAPDKSMRNRSGIVRELKLSTGKDASLTLSGPFSVNEDGLLSADWTLALSGAPAMAEVLANIFPERGDAIRTAFSGLSLLGDKPSLPLRIDEGEVKLAFVTLGEVPPLQ